MADVSLGFGLERANGPGRAAASRDVWEKVACAHPHRRVQRRRREDTQRDHSWLQLCVFVRLVCTPAFGHVCVCACGVVFIVCNPPWATAEASSQGKATTFGLISCLRVQGTLVRLAHQRRLEFETEPDDNKLPPSGIGRFASQLRAALFRASLSGGDDSELLFPEISCPVLGKGSVKVHRGDGAPLPYPPPPLPFFPPL